MLEILKYIFSSPFIFIGALILLSIIGEMIGRIFIITCCTIIDLKNIKYSNKFEGEN